MPATLYIPGEIFTQTPIPIWDLKKKTKRIVETSNVFEPLNQQPPTSKLLYKRKTSPNVFKSLWLIVILVILVIYLTDRIANYLTLFKAFRDAPIAYIPAPHIPLASLNTHWHSPAHVHMQIHMPHSSAGLSLKFHNLRLTSFMEVLDFIHTTNTSRISNTSLKPSSFQQSFIAYLLCCPQYCDSFYKGSKSK